MTKKSKMPKTGSWLMKKFIPGQDREFFMADVNEVYQQLLLEKGWVYACFWFWQQTIKILPIYLQSSLTGSLVMFKNYITIALRNINRQKTFSIINIGGLAIGMSVFIMISLYIQFELSYDEYHTNAEDIYTVAGPSQMVTPPPLAAALRDAYPEIENATTICNGGMEFRIENNIVHEPDWVWADKYIFDVFTFPLIAGEPKTALEKPYSLVISEKMALRYFGTENPVGKTLTGVLEFGDREFVVTGVMKNIPENSYIKGDFISSFKTIEEFGNSMEDWNNYYCNTFIQTLPNVDIKELEGKYSSYLESNFDIRGGNFEFLSLTDLHLKASDKIFHFSPVNDIKYIYIFLAIAIIILLVACINYMNLSTARSAKRAKEVGIRKVIGAKRSQLIKQFLGESIIMTFASLIIGVLIAYYLLPAFSNLVGCDTTLSLFNNAGFLIAVVMIGLMVSFISAGYPAFFISNFAPVVSLKGTSSGNLKGVLLRNTLVVVQFSISIFLIIGALVVADQLNFLRNKKLGYTKDQIVVISVSDNAVREKQQTVREELLSYPGITGVTFSTTIPMKIDWHNSFYYEGIVDPENDKIRTHYSRVGYDFVDLFELEIVKGRDFSRELDKGSFSYIINENIAKQLGWDDPIGKKYGNNNNIGTVVGVVKDFHNENMHIPIGPVTLVLQPEQWDLMSIKLRTNDVQKEIGAIEKVWNKFSAGYPFEYEFMDERYDNMYKTEIRMGRSFNYFSILAIFLCCLGLFGLASFTVEQCTKEIGIRKVLGASVPGIIKMLSWQFTKWVIIGNVIAWPMAYYVMHKWLEDFVYRTSIGIDIFIIAGIITFVIAFMTVLHQTLTASNANPVESLKYE